MCSESCVQSSTLSNMSTRAHGAPFESLPLLTRAGLPTTFLTLSESSPRYERFLRARRLRTRLWHIIFPIVFFVVAVWRPWNVLRQAAFGAKHRASTLRISWSLSMTLWKPR